MTDAEHFYFRQRILSYVRDQSVIELGDLAIDLLHDLHKSQRISEGLAERVAAQSDLLTRKAENPEEA